MISTTRFPGKYIQGCDAIKLLGPEILKMGKAAFLISDPVVFEKVLPGMLEGMDKKVKLVTRKFGVECSDEEISRQKTRAQKAGCDVVIGMGGGKTLDVAKAVAHALKIPMISVPTIASSDAPCTALSVIYDGDGKFNRLMLLPRSPDVVLVDTRIIVQAPARFLLAGMGDALSAMFESESCRQKYAFNLSGFHGSMTIYELARLSYDIILEYGLIAKSACEAHAVIPALEHVVEASTLLSGICHESAGAAAPHAISNGFTIFKETHGALHGEKVAFGTLASLFLTDKHKEEIDEVFSFAESVGLPTTIADLGLSDASDEQIMKAAETACVPTESIHFEPTPISVEAVFAAIKTADLEGRSRKALS